MKSQIKIRPKIIQINNDFNEEYKTSRIHRLPIIHNYGDYSILWCMVYGLSGGSEKYFGFVIDIFSKLVPTAKSLYL